MTSLWFSQRTKVFGHTLVRASGEANEFLSYNSIDFSGQKDFAKIFKLKNPFLNPFSHPDKNPFLSPIVDSTLEKTLSFYPLSVYPEKITLSFHP